MDDGVPCSGFILPESRNSPEAAKAILMPNGRDPAPAKRAAFRAFYLWKECLAAPEEGPRGGGPHGEHHPPPDERGL